MSVQLTRASGGVHKVRKKEREKKKEKKQDYILLVKESELEK